MCKLLIYVKLLVCIIKATFISSVELWVQMYKISVICLAEAEVTIKLIWN